MPDDQPDLDKELGGAAADFLQVTQSHELASKRLTEAIESVRKHEHDVHELAAMRHAARVRLADVVDRHRRQGLIEVRMNGGDVDAVVTASGSPELVMSREQFDEFAELGFQHGALREVDAELVGEISPLVVTDQRVPRVILIALDIDDADEFSQTAAPGTGPVLLLEDPNSWTGPDDRTVDEIRATERAAQDPRYGAAYSIASTRVAKRPSIPTQRA